MSMGYSHIQAKEALDVAGGDMEQAVGYLLMSDKSRRNLGQGLCPMPTTEVAVGELLDPPLQTDPSTIEDIQLREIVEMGYSEEVARNAVRVANGDVNQAINYLLMDESRAGFHVEHDTSDQIDDDVAVALLLQEEELYFAGTNAPLRNGPESAMYHATNNRSQIDVPRMVVSEAFLTTDGAGPFCACMAASKFLNGGVVTAAFLNDILAGGIELFRKGNSQQCDVGQVLKKYGKSNLGIDAISGEGEPKAAVFLLSDPNHTLGIRKQLALCRNQQSTGWQVLILEIPSFATLCIALPPKGSKNKFWYLDFQPRSCFRVTGAHARVHSTMLQLNESLEAIFRGLLGASTQEYANFSIYMIKKVSR